MHIWASKAFRYIGLACERRSWRLWLLVGMVFVSTGLSLWLGMQGRTLADASVKNGALILTQQGRPPQQVMRVASPDGANRLILASLDLTEQPDDLDSYAQYDAYLARQEKLMQILRSPIVVAQVKNPAGQVYDIDIRPVPLSLSTLSQSFWVSLAVGLTAFVIGCGVWCLKPRETPTRLLAVNGVAMLLASIGASGQIAGHLGAPPDLITGLIAINHFGAFLFGTSLVALFLSFPKSLVSIRTLSFVIAACVPLFGLDIGRLMGAPYGVLAFCFAVIAVTLVLIGVQFHASKAEPGLRASFLWLGLAVIAGIGSWGVIMMTYLVQGELRNMPVSLVFISFLILYAGIAIGVARFRLFDVADWAFRIFFFTVAAILFVALDAAMLYLLGETRLSALTTALLIVAFMYLPLRDLMWRRFMASKTLSEGEILGRVLDIAFLSDPTQRQRQWQDMLQNLFAPLAVCEYKHTVEMTHVDAEGLHLYVPALIDTTPVRLSYPNSGRGLFSTKHVALVNQIVRVSRQVAAGLNAYERGAAEQRQRLAQNLHDDVGARLVSGLNVADDATRPFLYAALAEIREIATALTTDSVPLSRVLAEMRHEAVRRFDAAQIALDWPLWPEDAPFIQMSALQKKGLSSAVREVVTNIIKHSGARRAAISFVLEGERLTASLSDDGVGLPQQVRDGIWQGQGLKSIAERMTGLNGQAHFANAAAGALITLSLPLNAGPEAPQP